MAKAYMAVDGHPRVRLLVEFRATAEQTADYLWDGLTWEEMEARGRLTTKRVDEAVREGMHRRGGDWFIENDDAYEQEGGREWALEHVRRVYKFPEEG